MSEHNFAFMEIYKLGELDLSVVKNMTISEIYRDYEHLISFFEENSKIEELMPYMTEIVTSDGYKCLVAGRTYLIAANDYSIWSCMEGFNGRYSNITKYSGKVVGGSRIITVNGREKTKESEYKIPKPSIKGAQIFYWAED